MCEILMTKKIFQNIFEAFHISASIIFLLFILFSILHTMFNIGKVVPYIPASLTSLSLFIAGNYLIRENNQNNSRKNKRC